MQPNRIRKHLWSKLLSNLLRRVTLPQRLQRQPARTRVEMREVRCQTEVVDEEGVPHPETGADHEEEDDAIPADIFMDTRTVHLHMARSIRNARHMTSHRAEAANRFKEEMKDMMRAGV
jgi:hypothetical protein